jgi:hypothetical protein
MKESVLFHFAVEKLHPGCRTFWKPSWMKPLNIFPSPLFYLISKVLCRAPDWIFLWPDTTGSSKPMLNLHCEFSGDHEIYLPIEIQDNIKVHQSVAHVDCFKLLCGITFSFRFTLYMLNLCTKVHTHLELFSSLTGRIFYHSL